MMVKFGKTIMARKVTYSQDGRNTSKKLDPFRSTLTVLLWNAVHPVHLKNRSIPPTLRSICRILRELGTQPAAVRIFAG